MEMKIWVNEPERTNNVNVGMNERPQNNKYTKEFLFILSRRVEFFFLSR